MDHVALKVKGLRLSENTLTFCHFSCDCLGDFFVFHHEHGICIFPHLTDALTVGIQNALVKLFMTHISSTELYI